MESKTFYIVDAYYFHRCYEESFTYLVIADTEKDALEKAKTYHLTRDDLRQRKDSYNYEIKYGGFVLTDNVVVEIDYNYVEH